MSAQPAVLQVVILRDGLLVGTEVFVPGQYAVGSEGDLRLDDASVLPVHAHVFFQNGRVAVQDAGGGVFVNGSRVNGCEVRSVDEIAIGPFSLKVRVMTQKAAAPKPAPHADVAAVLGTPSAPQATARPAAPAPVPAIAPAVAPAVPPQPRAPSAQPATVVSQRRAAGAPAVAPVASAPSPVPAPAPAPAAPLPLDFEEARTETVPMASSGPRPAPRPIPEITVPTVPPAKPPPAPAVTAPPVKPAVAPAPAPKPAPVAAAPARLADAPPAVTQPVPIIDVQKPAAPAPAPKKEPAAAPAPRPQFRRTITNPPAMPGASEATGKPHLFVEIYWGETRRFARGFSALTKKPAMAAEADSADVPLYGFGLGEGSLRFAEQVGPDVFRIFVPPNVAAERKATDGNFYPAMPESLEKTDKGEACITLGNGHALRLSGADDVTLVAYVQPAFKKERVNPLKGLPWLVMALIALFAGGFFTFVKVFTQAREEPDFQGKKLNPVAVRLIAPPKPEEKKKIEEKIQKVKRQAKPEEKVTQVDKAMPKVVTQETKKAIKAVEKLMAAGPAMKDLLAAVDKLGSGPGLKNAKNPLKLGELVGKQPIAAAGVGAFGLGGGGGGGLGIKGAELLRGKGGGGIGALGTGNIGKGAVGGTVTHAVARAVSAQGTIDKDAVAKVINSHLHEVSSCYERALLKEPGLAGKIVLEWTISTSGTVSSAKTKSSTMKSAAVEQCILGALKLWQFPKAQGSGVVISYPFMFNSVGY